MLLAIADCCNDAGLEAYPSIALLAIKTRLNRATVFRCLKRIASIGELEISGNRGRHSNTYAVLMDTLSLRDSHRQRRVARRGTGRRHCRPADNQREPSQNATVEPSQAATDEPSRYRDSTRRGTATGDVAVPRPDPSLNHPRTGTAAAAAANNAPPATSAAAGFTQPDPAQIAGEEFLAWWEFAYPAYNGGAISGPNLASHGAIVAELLAQRPAARLRSMAIVMWLLTGKPAWRGGHIGGTLIEPDPAETWIVQSDRSLHVLRHKADWLDRQVAQMPAWWLDCPHTPRCDEASGCQLRLAEVSPDGPPDR